MYRCTVCNVHGCIEHDTKLEVKGERKTTTQFIYFFGNRNFNSEFFRMRVIQLSFFISLAIHILMKIIIIDIVFSFIDFSPRHIKHILNIWVDRFPAPPYISELSNQTAVVNGNVTFTCQIMADLAAHVTWAKYHAFDDSDTDFKSKPNTIKLEVYCLTNYFTGDGFLCTIS